MMENYLSEYIENNPSLFDDYKVKLWQDVRQPLSVTIELTPHCNFNCIHCYMKNCHSMKEMTNERIIDILDTLHEKGILFLTLTGGEVLVRRDFEEIYTYAKKKGFIVGVFTNAYRINDEIIHLFKKYPPLLVDVSLYGADEYTYKKVTGVSGAFEVVIDHCKKMVSEGIRVALKSPIINETLNSLEKMRDIAKKIGVDFRYSFDISPTIDNDKSTEKLEVPVEDMFRAEIHDPAKMREGKKNAALINPYCDKQAFPSVPLFLCQIAVNDFFIDYNGRMCPCASFRNAGVELSHEKFDEIWESFGRYKQMIASEEYQCARCNSRLFCKLCPAEMESYYNDLEAIPSSMCKFAKIRKAYYKDMLSEEDAIERIVSNNKGGEHI